jgi:hypothetical protein
MQLSENFSFEELTNTSHTELLEKNREEAKQYIESLTKLATLVLQPLRESLGKSITVSSGFRGHELNEKVGGTSTSQHSFGEAADIQVDGMGVSELFNYIKNMPSEYLENVGQVIIEKVNGKEWVHISVKTERYKKILQERYGSANTVFLKTTDGKNYERVS